MQVKVVVGIHNEGPETYNITAVMGSINNVKNFKDYHQNFTTQVRPLAQHTTIAQKLCFWLGSPKPPCNLVSRY